MDKSRPAKRSALSHVHCVIPAAGCQERWGNFNGLPKQLVNINGERLIHRLIRQVNYIGIYDVVVVTSDKRFVRHYARWVAPQLSLLPGTGIGHSAAAWNQGDNLVLMSDILLSREGVYTIKRMIESLPSGAVFFGHRDGGVDKNPEIMGVYIPEQSMDSFLDAIKFVRDNEIPRVSGGWQIYRAYHGIPLAEHRVQGGWCELPQECIDFDSPDDYLCYLSRWNAAVV